MRGKVRSTRPKTKFNAMRLEVERRVVAVLSKTQLEAFIDRWALTRGMQIPDLASCVRVEASIHAAVNTVCWARSAPCGADNIIRTEAEPCREYGATHLPDECHSVDMSFLYHDV